MNVIVNIAFLFVLGHRRSNQVVELWSQLATGVGHDGGSETGEASQHCCFSLFMQLFVHVTNQNSNRRLISTMMWNGSMFKYAWCSRFVCFAYLRGRR